MATQSILKSVHIKDKKHSRKFISALKRAVKANGKNVNLPYDCKRIRQDEIKAFFDNKRYTDVL